MTDDDAFARTTPLNPLYLVAGALVLGALTLADLPDGPRLAVAVLASVLGAVGCIAAGVAHGIRYADHLRDT